MTKRIGAWPLVLLPAVLLLAACGAVRKTAAGQQAAELRSGRSERVAMQTAAAGDTTRHRQQQAQTDTTTVRRTYAEPVPAAETQMSVPVQHLLDLPEGAKYTARNGRAGVEAERQGDRIVVRGRCDSIARRCTWFEQRVLRQNTLIDSLTARLSTAGAYRAHVDSTAASEMHVRRTVEQTEKPAATGHWWLLAGFLAGGAASALLTKTNPLKAIFSLIKKVV